MCKEGCAPSVRRKERAVLEEIVAVGEAYGVGADHLSGSASFEDYLSPVIGLDRYYAHVRGPKTPKVRYLTEDVPYGAVPTSKLGRKAGVATHVLDGLIVIASVVCEEDYRTTGRTLKSLGLDELSKEQIVSLVEDGL